MPLARTSERLLLSTGDVTPSHDDIEVIGVFNPGAAIIAGEVVLLARVAERPRERRPGFTPLPRWTAGEGITIDWVADERLDKTDPRVVKRVSNGQTRLTFVSHLRVVRLGDGSAVREVSSTRLDPESDGEEYGLEDPRITVLDGRYRITYVAVSCHGVTTALASTGDFQRFERHGVILGPDNKDVVLFPERIKGDYVVIHRPSSPAGFHRPEMWLARSPDLIHWGRHEPLYGGQADWEADRVGAGPPPVRTPEGWLLIYHASSRPKPGQRVGVYSVGALLLDLENPAHVLKRTVEPILVPTSDHETRGFVAGVVFPTGLIERGPTIMLFSGAADERTTVLELDRDDILNAMS